ncbi:MAG: iron-sulfur cluster repair di-iron protein [Myxococcales bacterium]
MTTFETSTPVGQIATSHPGAGRVLMRHNIDFCCGGRRSLADACASAGIDAAALLSEIAAEEPQRDDVRWDLEPVDGLIGHILEAYHRPLDEELPRIAGLMNKVTHRHGDENPWLAELKSNVDAVIQDLVEHMVKEERVLFPWILSGNGRTAGGPIQVMHTEHDTVAWYLGKIRSQTGDYVPPAGACNSWRALWIALEGLEVSLKEHIHLENNVLFPRALAA